MKEKLEEQQEECKRSVVKGERHTLPCKLVTSTSGSHKTAVVTHAIHMDYKSNWKNRNIKKS